jgi:hypothetical protein
LVALYLQREGTHGGWDCGAFNPESKELFKTLSFPYNHLVARSRSPDRDGRAQPASSIHLETSPDYLEVRASIPIFHFVVRGRTITRSQDHLPNGGCPSQDAAACAQTAVALVDLRQALMSDYPREAELRADDGRFARVRGRHYVSARRSA